MKPELANYLNAEATKLKAAQKTEREKKKPVVAIYVEGGVVQGARSNVEGIEVKVFDVDNLKAEMSRKEIDETWKLWEASFPYPLL